MAMSFAAILTGVAEAQQGADEATTGIPQSTEQNANQESTPSATVMETRPMSEAVSRVVVNPGDSLWSIAQKHLGPEATPQQVDDSVAEIYTLNRGVIGDNPDLILPGWELSVPAASAPRTGNTVASEPEANEPTTNGEPATAEPASQPTTNYYPSGETAASRPASEPAASKPATGNSTGRAGFSQNERRLLGIGTLMLTLLVALLMLWKLPMSRDVEMRRRRMLAAEYYSYYRHGTNSATQSTEDPPIGSSPATERFWGESGEESLADKQPHDLGLAAALRSAKRKKRRPSRTSSRGRRRLRGGWTSSAYAPQVRRHLRRTTGAKAQRARGQRAITKRIKGRKQH
jgi:LysM domain